MPVTEIGDPRLNALFGANDPRDAGVRPVVELPRRGVPPMAIAIAAGVLALLLFVVLNSRRISQVEPTVQPVSATSGTAQWEPPTPLYIPPEPAASVESPVRIVQEATVPRRSAAPAPAVSPRILSPQPVYVPTPLPQMLPPPTAAQPRTSSGAPLVIDTGTGPTPSGAGAISSALAPSGRTTTRMRASALANRSMTVPQGYVIPAVLETGFNSTQPGFARAVVSREVRSFDGTNVLIPRGSRLIGEYRADVAQGQKRAVILWTRLIRPDGMTIAMDSPAIDTLGRGGVPAAVNTHFWQRLGDALLQTTVGIGAALAQRSVSGPVIVLPGNGSAVAGRIAPTNNYVPTLTVPPGKSISVFVAHDLDFSAAGAQQ